MYILTVRGNGVSVQVAYTLHLICLAAESDFIGFHGLLNGLTDVTQPGVNPSLTDPSIGGGFHGLHQLVVLGVKGQGEGAVNDPTCGM